MTQPDAPDQGVIILPPDRKLLKKLQGVPLDKALSPEVILKAQKTIVDASADLYKECVTESRKLQNAVEALVRNPAAKANLKSVIDIAFSIKTKAAQSGYNLIAALAKSLHLLCETLIVDTSVNEKSIKLIKWHTQSVIHLLGAKIHGDGGETGKAILAEIESIKPRTD